MRRLPVRVAGCVTRLARLVGLVGLAGLLGLVLAGPCAALDLDPRPERVPLSLPGELFGPDAATEGRLLVKIGTKKIKYSRVLETDALTLVGQSSPDRDGNERTLANGQGSPFIAFGRFNEVGLEVRDADPANPTLAALTVRAPDGRTFGSDPLECVDHLGETWLAGIAPQATVDVAGGQWADKNALYLAKRVLDLPFDDVWRSAQDGPSTFLQRRFDRDILDLGAVDIVLRRPAPVQLNLVVALDPAKPQARTVLDWYALAKRTYELPDGRTVLRVSVGRYLRERYPGIKWARLKEISLMFFRQGPAEVARDRLVARLVFTPSGFAPAELAQNGLPGHLPTRVREPFAGVRRVFVNLTQAAQAIGPDGRARASLRLTPMAPDQPGGGTAEGAFLARTSPRRDTPAFLAAADELATSLGAAPDIDRPDGGVPVTALWSLSPPFAKAGPGQRRSPASLGDPVAEPVFVSGGGGLFTAPGNLRLFRSAAGLALEGQGKQVDMAVNAAFVPNPGANHFFRLDIGRTPGLTGVVLDVFAPGGGSPVHSYPLLPGQPTPLPDLPARVGRAVVRFTFSGEEFSLAITRAALTAVPTGRAGTGLYEAALPWPVTTTAVPAPSASGTPAGAPVATAASDASGHLPAAYVPQTPFGRLSWLTADFTLVGDPVAVSVAGGQPAVPDTRSGVIAARLPATAARASLAVTGLGGQAPGQLELTDPVFSGEAEAGWRSLFAALPLLALDGTRHAPGPVSEETAARLNAADAWLGLGAARLPAKASARFFDNPWYGVSALCFETDAPLHLSYFAAPPKAAIAAAGLGTLGRVLAGLALVAAGALGLRLAGQARLSRLLPRPLAWLANPPVAAAQLRRQRLANCALAAGLVLAGLTLGGVAGRVVLGLAGLTLVALWRVLAPWVAGRLARPAPQLGPWLAADAGRSYFLGFALALTAGAGLRSLGLVQAAEFCVQGGLYTLLAGLTLSIPTSADNRAKTPEDTAS